MIARIGVAPLALALAVASSTRDADGEAWSPAVGRLAVTQALAEHCQGVRSADECAKAIEKSQAASGRFKRTGDLLVVKIANGRDVELRDAPADKVGTTPDDAVSRFAYIEFLASTGQHLVHVWGYEGTEFLLIDARTGSRTRLFGLPVPSPSGSRIACSPVHLAVDVQRVEVWRRAGDGFIREWARDLTWAPGPPQWLGEDAIRVRALDPGATTTATFRRTGEAWSDVPAK
jgi:hypothetical protein